jgi:hypothetical protein
MSLRPLLGGAATVSTESWELHSGQNRTQRKCCRLPHLRTSGSRKTILCVESFPLPDLHETLVLRSVGNAGRRTDRCPSARWSDGSAAKGRQPRHSVAGTYVARCSAPSANTGHRQSQPAAVGRRTTGLVAGAVPAVGPGRRHCLYIYVCAASRYPRHRPRCLGRAVSHGASRSASPPTTVHGGCIRNPEHRTLCSRARPEAAVARSPLKFASADTNRVMDLRVV